MSLSNNPVPLPEIKRQLQERFPANSIEEDPEAGLRRPRQHVRDLIKSWDFLARDRCIFGFIESYTVGIRDGISITLFSYDNNPKAPDGYTPILRAGVDHTRVLLNELICPDSIKQKPSSWTNGNWLTNRSA